MNKDHSNPLHNPSQQAEKLLPLRDDQYSCTPLMHSIQDDL